jgi:NADH-quinone oxidoreductase subunit M
LKSKIVFAFIAGIGVALAAVYTIRLFQRSMHNPIGEAVQTREMSVADGFVLVPVVAAILVLALYPQLVLKRTEKPVTNAPINPFALIENYDR